MGGGTIWAHSTQVRQELPWATKESQVAVWLGNIKPRLLEHGGWGETLIESDCGSWASWRRIMLLLFCARRH
eukprot:1520510-Amphidinium_carterae.1